jgi:predicted alpha/beta-fold hydrolase
MALLKIAPSGGGSYHASPTYKGAGTKMEHATFFAPRWLANRHIQTLGAALPLFAPPRRFTEHRTGDRVTFALPDGDHLVARAWWQPGLEKRRAVLLVHGVGGSSESMYMLRGAVAMHRAGYHALRLNVRAAGEGVTAAKLLYNATMTGDLHAAIDALAEDPRVSDVVVVGFSLGGNASLLLAGQRGESGPKKLRAIASISAPTDIPTVADVLERPETLPYRAFVVRNLVRNATRFARLHPTRAEYDVRALRRVKTIREYDAHVIVPMHGFASTRDYYDRASSAPHLKNIRVPTLIVHAEDDPMVPGHTVSPTLRDLPSCVKVAWSKAGGHVGFISGIREPSWVRTWAIAQTLDFFATIQP